MSLPPEKSLSFGAAERAEAARLVDWALEEDRTAEDLTSRILFGEERAPRSIKFETVRACCVAKDDGVLCGVPIATMLYGKVDPRIQLTFHKTDGECVTTGESLLDIAGPARSVLAGERATLNFLQRLSGIATTTSRWVRELEGFSTTLLDTRKTTPGWRFLEKYAVRAGGADNHRLHLADGILLKDNHTSILRACESTELREWVALLRRQAPDSFLEVEVESRAEFLEARQTDADAILLDNFSLEDLSWAVERNREMGGPRPLLEASGGIILERLRVVAATGVDRISAGALTHSALALDLSIELSNDRACSKEDEK